LETGAKPERIRGVRFCFSTKECSVNLKNFADGLAIIRAFYDDQDGYHIGAEHDQIYLYATDVPMDAAAIAKLQEIGWFQDEAENDADGKPIYDPSSSWSVFV
jgi:hypothetical protein